MSLIYDYLKIHGKNGPDGDVDVEIPPALMRRDSSKPNRPSLLLILASCIIGVLFILIVFRVFNPAQDIQTGGGAGPVSPVQGQLDRPAEFESTQPQVNAAQAEEAQAFEQKSSKNIQVFPETENSAVAANSVVHQLAESVEVEPGVILKKPVQPLVLENKNRKIVFQENIPVYAEPQVPVGNMAAVAPGKPGRSPATDTGFHPSTGASPAVLEKSKKFYQAGLQAQYKGDRRTAEIYYKKALEGVPDHMDAMINLSALYVQQERFHDAENILAEIIAIEPTNSKALVNMGMISLSQGHESRAAAQFQAALDANPHEENALVNLAFLAEKNKNHLSTEMYYRQLLQISPDNLEVLLAYGHLLEEQGRYSEAMAVYGDTLALDPVKKDQRLHTSISDRMRLLAGAERNSLPDTSMGK